MVLVLKVSLNAGAVFQGNHVDREADVGAVFIFVVVQLWMVMIVPH